MLSFGSHVDADDLSPFASVHRLRKRRSAFNESIRIRQCRWFVILSLLRACGSLRGPGLFSLDTSFFKKLKISEGLYLQFRAEAFNVLNHPSFAYPNEVIFQGTNYSSSAGVITNTSTTSRQIQFALKLMY